LQTKRDKMGHTIKLKSWCLSPKES
jgi:hypothetical protein